jgi:cytochrome P450
MLIPLRLVGLINPHILSVAKYQMSIASQAKEVFDDKDLDPKSRDRAPFLYEIRDSDLPPEEKTLSRMTDEATVLVGAGSETTGNTLSITTYHLLQNPDMLRRLKDELDSVKPGPAGILEYKALRELPYLRAVISEGLRITTGVAGRLPRVNPKGPMKYQEWTIPAGTTFSMSPLDIHFNETIFPEPRVFRPERWLGEEKKVQELERYLVPFSRGSRNCVGMSLAYAELYLTLGNVFRNYNLTIYETDPSDLETANVFFASFPKESSRGLRVKVL